MKEITVQIPEKKFKLFMELLQAFDFVEIIQPAPGLEDQLSPAQKRFGKTSNEVLSN